MEAHAVACSLICVLSICAPPLKSATCAWATKRIVSCVHNTHFCVTYNNSLLPLERTPRMLGVTSDPHFTCKANFQTIVTRATSRINILKAIAVTNCGQQMQMIFITYASYIRSLFNYAAPIYFPKASSFLVQKLQTIGVSVLQFLVQKPANSSGRSKTSSPLQDYPFPTPLILS